MDSKQLANQMQDCLDELVFQDDDLLEQPMSISQPLQAWKVLIVDDEQQVHSVTRLALKNFSFDNKVLELVSAYSATEAQQILQNNKDIAVVLLDVVMETDDAGLELIKYIRRQLNNHHIRIILRTGQPGVAPEISIVEGYDINDYKTKTELTQAKLFSTLITAIRSYRDIVTVEDSRQEIAILNQKLQDLNHDLERLVRARTRQLEDKNRQLENEIEARLQAQKRLEATNQELDEANRKLSFWANFDELTGLANRRCFNKYLTQLWRQAFRDQQPLCVVLCDIDFFKLYNDTYGHLAGDACLKKVGLAFREVVVRPLDLAARYGGEEFVVVLHNTDGQGGEVVAQRLQAVIHSLQITHDHSTVSEHISLSIGVASMTPISGITFETLLSKADDALYDAKKNGRNQIIKSDLNLV